jgi:hypothetical protein
MRAESSTSGEKRRGIPTAAFVEEVETYLSQFSLDVNASLSSLGDALAVQACGDEASCLAKRSPGNKPTTIPNFLYISYSYPFPFQLTCSSFFSTFSRPKFLTLTKVLGYCCCTAI